MVRRSLTYLLLAGAALLSVVYIVGYGERRILSDEVVLELMFGQGGTEARWQVQADSLDYAIASRDLNPIAQQQLLKLIDEISSIIGIGFNGLSVEHITRADVALFAGPYRDSREFEQWETSANELYQLITSHRNTSLFDRFASQFTTSIVQPREAASPNAPEPSEPHLQDGQPSCRFVSSFSASANNWALSAFGQAGTQLSPGPMQLCFLRSFLSVVGLRGVRRFPAEDLVVEDQQGNARLSPLVRCALEVFYHPTLATRVTLEDRSLDKAKRILASNEVCK